MERKRIPEIRMVPDVRDVTCLIGAAIKCLSDQELAAWVCDLHDALLKVLQEWRTNGQD